MLALPAGGQHIEYASPFLYSSTSSPQYPGSNEKRPNQALLGDEHVPSLLRIFFIESYGNLILEHLVYAGCLL